ncbi:iron transporter [Methylobacterium trifolii]|uniref:Iron transporter n=1 Tax=Methylobacterium trifolii TaxID=1003092 RepID=A0ABQ4U2G3_9HYPH|nr:iron transporter [Methylobacterium trifolii]GJE61664.1 hypothetical protein MPOCJGCO_3787 [Methylobacterium trifolii]
MGARQERWSGPAYRFGVAGRVVLASLGSYVVASLLTALLSLTLPLVRSEAVTAATLLSFLVITLLALYVFAARSLGRAALTLGLVGLALAAALWLAGGFSAPGPAA